MFTIKAFNPEDLLYIRGIPFFPHAFKSVFVIFSKHTSQGKVLYHDLGSVHYKKEHKLFHGPYIFHSFFNIQQQVLYIHLGKHQIYLKCKISLSRVTKSSHIKQQSMWCLYASFSLCLLSMCCYYKYASVVLRVAEKVTQSHILSS